MNSMGFSGRAREGASVRTYQFFQNMSGQSVVMAAFILNSISVLLVFLFCQKIILRGIILPQMK